MTNPSRIRTLDAVATRSAGRWALEQPIHITTARQSKFETVFAVHHVICLRTHLSYVGNAQITISHIHFNIISQV